MRRALLAMILVIVGTVSCMAGMPPAVRTAEPSTHVIFMKTLMMEGHCSATSIGPHALLTASHCEAPTSTIEVDHQNAKIVKVIRDDFDHTIFLLDDITFDSWVTVRQNVFNVGDDVFLFGNPGNFRNLYRSGSVAGYRMFGFMQTIMEFNLHTFYGDSGAAIFNSNGEVVAVLSVGDQQRINDETFEMTGAFLMSFKPEELTLARFYGIPEKSK